MINKLIAEATEGDFKVSLESEKPRSWLKSISAFSNGIGGSLFFGVNNDKVVIGLTDPQKDAEEISRLIKERISPLPDFVLTPYREDGRDVLVLDVSPGRQTPYYYKYQGVTQAYIRVGNESIPAPDYALNELILKGTNRFYDAQPSEKKKDQFSFTLLEATYRQRAGIPFEQKDYLSFGLVDENGFLTTCGTLLADQHNVYNSRIFCTRWNGLEKGSIFDDAVNDREYEGNLLYLLQNAQDFILNNSKMGFKKEADYRVDKPDYADRAVTEILVNALIHRDYLIQGSEIHVDMFDDRLEIYSPGGMYKGRAIQERDIYSIESIRRNPHIADLFHRMRFMERRGSGLEKIVTETEKLPGYTDALKPSFFSTDVAFHVVLKNVNYVLSGATQDAAQVNTQVAIQDKTSDVERAVVIERLLAFCSEARSRDEIMAHLGFANRSHFRKAYIVPLLDNGQLKMTIPDKPNSRYQKYLAT